MILPTDITAIFYQTLIGEKSLLDFEEWVYSEKKLESILTSEDYIDLISFDYKDNRSKVDINKFLFNHIDKGDFEKWKLLKLLYRALKRDHELPEILRSFYKLYCKGYNFLGNLGESYGLTIQVPYPETKNWEALSTAEQREILNSFYPQIEIEIRKVIDWLESGKIVLTGNVSEYGTYEFIDLQK